MADDYALTHTSKFGRVSQSVRENQRSPGDSQPSTPNSHSNSRDQNEPTLRSPRFPSGPTCFYCKKKGHVLSECRALEKKNQKSHMLVATKDARMNCLGILHCGPLANSNSAMTKGYTPFVSHGTVCLEGGEKVPIYILRDTGAAQSLILDSTLPFSQKSSTGVSVLLQGVELGAINVPLHTVYLHSDLVSGPVAVELRPCLPVKGISLILGNDLAGDKVVVNPQVLETCCKDTKWEQGKQFEGLFPSCAVTRAMAKTTQIGTHTGKDDELRDEKLMLAESAGTFPGGEHKTPLSLLEPMLFKS